MSGSQQVAWLLSESEASVYTLSWAMGLTPHTLRNRLDRYGLLGISGSDSNED